MSYQLSKICYLYIYTNVPNSYLNLCPADPSLLFVVENTEDPDQLVS